MRLNFKQLKSCIAGAVLCVCGTVQASSPSVLVEFNGQYSGYFERPRLSQVLLGIQSDKSLYWPAARLYKLDADYIVAAEQLRAEVLEQLRLLTIHWQAEPRVAAHFMQLRTEITNWRLAKPMHLPLDADKARTQPDFDPKLDEGQYLLQAKTRPGFVTFTGLGGDQFIEHQADSYAYMYLAKAHGIEQSGVDIIYWLNAVRLSSQIKAGQPFELEQPPIQLPVASWNRNQQQLPPGALLFVPIPAQWLPDSWQDLNQQLLQLIQSRVYK